MSTDGDGDVLGETYLRERGVLVETFLSHGGEIDSSPHCAKISERLNRDLDTVRLSKDWKEVKEILWIPVSNCQVARAYWLARPLPAFKKLKFIAPVGSDSLPWIPPKTREIAKDIDSPIVITEGPIKAMALLQAGALPISLQGVWGSAEKKKAGPERQSEEDDEGDADTDRKESSDRGEKLKLHPELARFNWEYRQVLLCLDADRFKNKNVRQAEIRLAFLLHSAGAEVYQLSTWTLEEGKGVDDYLARRAGADLEKQREAFAELLRRARPFHATLQKPCPGALIGCETVSRKVAAASPLEQIGEEATRISPPCPKGWNCARLRHWNNVGRETAVFMKEVLVRIELPPWEDIPDEAMIASKPGGLNRWTIPHTEITLVRLKEGLHEGNWVFNSETDERAPEFYEQVKQMPYKPGASEGLYQLFVSEPGWMIPRSLIGALPGWMQLRPGGQAVWQWCALVLTLLVTAVLMVLIFRLVGYWSRTRRGAGYYLAMVFPIFAIVLPQTATDFLSDQVFITGKLFAVLDFALDLVSLGALVALILGITNRLATAIMVLPWFKPRQLNAQLAQLIIRAMGVAGALIAVFEGGRYLGVPLTTLVAGVSVSGLTVALAAQDTLRNLFGSLMILLDRPFQMGDLIRIKGHQGTVESVGLRSTRIRDASGHVVSIPNEEVARLDSENVSRRSHLRRQEVLRLSADTPTEKIRTFVDRVRGILENHEGFDPRFPPSVKIGLADDAVTVTITYCYFPPDAAASDAFNEKVTLQILEVMAEEGIHL